MSPYIFLAVLGFDFAFFMNLSPSLFSQCLYIQEYGEHFVDDNTGKKPVNSIVSSGGESGEG
jgi:hypothetical protein